MRQDDLRRHIGLVQQDVFLFSDSVADNIGYGKEGATEEEIRAAARMAAAETFIEVLPQGFATPVGERGVKLSGGQKQRIAIARVILKNPTVVILDEATSALDTETEEQVRKTLETVARNRTTILVAHRLSTVRNADRIIVLDQGQIIEDGNHESLLEKKGKYWSLCEAQKREKKE
jgi:ATP-binding cassette, subfamily B, bacterial